MNSPNVDAPFGWTTSAPAKVNLDLRLRDVRADGYHLLSTLLHSIALADTLTIRRAEGPFSIGCDTPGVPTDASNLAWRGAQAMAAALAVSLDGWHLHLEKQVPAEAGLGGGSADAAAAARLVASVAGVALSPDQLAAVIRPLGADVAFFAWGGAMRGEGVGDQLFPAPDVPDATVVVVRPPFGVATRDAYRWYDEGRAASSLRMPAPASNGGTADVAAHWGNDLEAPVAVRHPEIRAIVGRLRAAGAWLAAMSGSGSACFGLFSPDASMDGVLSGWAPGTRVWQTRLLRRPGYLEATACRPLMR